MHPRSMKTIDSCAIHNAINYKEQEVYVIPPKRIKDYLDAAALAFERYPLFDYILGKGSCAKDIKTIISVSIKASEMPFVALSNGESKRSLAIFFQPDFQGTPAIPFLLSGGLKLIPKNHFLAIPRLIIYDNYAMKMMKKYTKGNCW